MQPALGDPALAGGLDWVTRRGPFQPRPCCDSVTWSHTTQPHSWSHATQPHITQTQHQVTLLVVPQPPNPTVGPTPPSPKPPSLPAPLPLPIRGPAGRGLRCTCLGVPVPVAVPVPQHLCRQPIPSPASRLSAKYLGAKPQHKSNTSQAMSFFSRH